MVKNALFPMGHVKIRKRPTNPVNNFASFHRISPSSKPDSCRLGLPIDMPADSVLAAPDRRAAAAHGVAATRYAEPPDVEAAADPCRHRARRPAHPAEQPVGRAEGGPSGPAQLWLNLQSEYDMRVADRELRAKLVPRIRVLQPAAS
jgi:hypothetical protein